EDQIVALTVEEEVGFALENYRFAPPEIHRRIDYALDLVGLDGFRRRETLHLSGGEKQRVAGAGMGAVGCLVVGWSCICLLGTRGFFVVSATRCFSPPDK
ncbi:MAG: hypothetical protein O6930_01160, partial [Gammaproteobacteria bacterium]|nr:hypothetical protein [Gammaproteobacteria bacterium]